MEDGVGGPLEATAGRLFSVQLRGELGEGDRIVRPPDGWDGREDVVVDISKTATFEESTFSQEFLAFSTIVNITEECLHSPLLAKYKAAPWVSFLPCALFFSGGAWVSFLPFALFFGWRHGSHLNAAPFFFGWRFGFTFESSAPFFLIF